MKEQVGGGINFITIYSIEENIIVKMMTMMIKGRKYFRVYTLLVLIVHQLVM